MVLYSIDDSEIVRYGNLMLNTGTGDDLLCRHSAQSLSEEKRMRDSTPYKMSIPGKGAKPETRYTSV